MQHLDPKLFLKLQEGDVSSFEIIFKNLQPRLFVFAKRILRDEELAREAVMDVFLHLWSQCNKISIKKSIEAYLYTSTKNQCLNYIRAQKGFLKTFSPVDLKLIESEMHSYNEDNIIETLHAEALQEQITQIINKLPDQQQKVFSMSRFEGLSSDDIASELNIAKRTVETHIYLAIKQIRTQVELFLA